MSERVDTHKLQLWVAADPGLENRRPGFWSHLCQVCSGVILGKRFLTLGLSICVLHCNRGSVVISVSDTDTVLPVFGIMFFVSTTQPFLSLPCLPPPLPPTHILVYIVNQ